MSQWCCSYADEVDGNPSFFGGDLNYGCESSDRSLQDSVACGEFLKGNFGVHRIAVLVVASQGYDLCQRIRAWAFKPCFIHGDDDVSHLGNCSSVVPACGLMQVWEILRDESIPHLLDDCVDVAISGEKMSLRGLFSENRCGD